MRAGSLVCVNGVVNQIETIEGVLRAAIDAVES